MTQVHPIACLADFQLALEDANFECRETTLYASKPVLLAENPYSLVAILEANSLDEIENDVFDAQAELSRLVAESSRTDKRWDLYVLVHLRTLDSTKIDTRVLEGLEADTRYARKFIRCNLENDREELDRALRPFLPLRPATAFEPQDALQLLRAALIEHGAEPHIVDSALESYRTEGEINI